MKSTATTSDSYESPGFWVIDINTESLVTTSPTGLDNEEYEEGNTDGWFND